MCTAFKRRRNFMVERMSAILGESVKAPAGAFYLFLPVNKLYGKTTPEGAKIEGSIDFCKFLLESEGLAIVPGAAFGDDTCVRFSYAASDESLAKACERFERGVKSLRG